jgi:Flp pilus assembly protein TadD
MGETLRNGYLKILSGLAVCTLLAACQTTGTAGGTTESQVGAAMERAAIRSGQGGSLSFLEGAYKRNPEDEQAALGYARALNEADYPERAAAILGPFANKASSSAASKREFAAIQLKTGKYEAAEKYAQKAIVQDPTDYQAFHYLGIALDAQGMHKEGERAFRKGLELWQGDPTPIMNNLALNLSAQGFLDEAADILMKAKAIAPDRIEIERNLRIVNTLQQSEKYKAPKPDRKPPPA